MELCDQSLNVSNPPLLPNLTKLVYSVQTSNRHRFRKSVFSNCFHIMLRMQNLSRETIMENEETDNYYYWEVMALFCCRKVCGHGKPVLISVLTSDSKIFKK